MIRSGTMPADKLFTGQQRETTNGIYHYGARFYNADLGRFVQADSIVPGAGNPQALNRYSYVLNNPIKYSDPSGHKPMDMDECWHNGKITCGGGDSAPPPGGSYGEAGVGGGAWNPQSVVGQPDPLLACSSCVDLHEAWLYDTMFATIALHRLGPIDSLGWTWDQRGVLLSVGGLGVTDKPPEPGTYWYGVMMEAGLGWGLLGVAPGGGGPVKPGAVIPANRTAVNMQKQARHIAGPGEVPKASLISIDVGTAQRLINQRAGTGQVLKTDAAGQITKELVDFGVEIGVAYDLKSELYVPTTRGTIHYSRTGSHLVPTLRR